MEPAWRPIISFHGQQTIKEPGNSISSFGASPRTAWKSKANFSLLISPYIPACPCTVWMMPQLRFHRWFNCNFVGVVKTARFSGLSDEILNRGPVPEVDLCLCVDWTLN